MKLRILYSFKILCLETRILQKHFYQIPNQDAVSHVRIHPTLLISPRRKMFVHTFEKLGCRSPASKLLFAYLFRYNFTSSKRETGTVQIVGFFLVNDSYEKLHRNSLHKTLPSAQNDNKFHAAFLTAHKYTTVNIELRGNHLTAVINDHNTPSRMRTKISNEENIFEQTREQCLVPVSTRPMYANVTCSIPHSFERSAICRRMRR